MDDTTNAWFHPHDPDATFWRTPAAPLPWREWRPLLSWRFAQDLLPVPGRSVYRSDTPERAGHLPPPAGFEFIHGWSRPPLRLLWIHLSERVILCYAENELTYLACSTPEAWREAIAELNRIYPHT